MADQSRTDRRPLPPATRGPQPWRPPERPEPRRTPGAVTALEPFAVPAVLGWVDPDEQATWCEHRDTAPWRATA